MNTDMSKKKQDLINSLIQSGVLKTKEIIEAFIAVKREEFVLPQYKDYAYADEPLPILAGQTISQPYTVAAMTEALHPEKGQKILEIGTGSGYQAAILAEIVGKKGMVITTERIKELFEFANNNLKKSGCVNVIAINADGTAGYAKHAPYDRIIVTASSPEVPKPLIEQLKAGGRMVIPVGDEMFLIEKISKTETRKTFLGYYAFVPLIGRYGHGYK